MTTITQPYHNMKLLGQHPLDGFGNCGEGMALQRTRDRRRILWIAHESAPKNVTAVDVTNPKKPAVVAQTDLPHDKMRSNSLDVVGDLVVVAYQTSAVGLTPAGFEVFNVADPAKPRSVGFFDASGPSSRGVHHLWFVDVHYVHVASGAAGSSSASAWASSTGSGAPSAPPRRESGTTGSSAFSREPLPLPVMKLNPEVKDIFAFRFEDFELVGYQAHPHIAAPVAV